MPIPSSKVKGCFATGIFAAQHIRAPRFQKQPSHLYFPLRNRRMKIQDVTNALRDEMKMIVASLLHQRPRWLAALHMTRRKMRGRVP